LGEVMRVEVLKMRELRELIVGRTDEKREDA
jgi:hypothetical protein